MRERLHARRGPAYLYAGLLVAVPVVWSVPSLLTHHPRVDAVARHTAIAATRTGLGATLAALGAIGGLAYTARTYRLSQEGHRLSREGHFTDRYSKAVEQLGSDKIEVRLGGIYALERLMRDSTTYQPTIVEVLAADVREHAPPAYSKIPDLPSSPAADVQAALTVLGRCRRTAVAAENPINLTRQASHDPPDSTGRTCSAPGSCWPTWPTPNSTERT